MTAAAQVMLSESLRAEVLVYAREALPDEACGFLVGVEDSGPGSLSRFRLAAILPARNLHPDGQHRFIMDPMAYGKAEKYCLKHRAQGYRVLGFWHSHPSSPAKPSHIDLEEACGLYQSFPTRYLYLILSLAQEAGELCCWSLDEEGKTFVRVEITTA